MKKVFLFMAVAALTFSLNSCSSDSGGGSSVSFKVGGTSKSFKTTATSSGGTVFVIGYIGSAADPSETVSFSIESGATGDVMDNISYTNDTDTYYSGSGTSDVTLNNGSSVKGTFSGTLEPFDSANPTLTVTNGKFSASY